jgi:hypothetical protein
LKRAAKGLAILVLTLLALIVGGLLFLDATLGSGMCHTTVYSTVRSNAGDVTARTQMTDCGATTGFSRVVMLVKQGLWVRECRALALSGEPSVKMTWYGDTLFVSHNANHADIIAQSDKCFGHAIKIVQER